MYAIRSYYDAGGFVLSLIGSLYEVDFYYSFLSLDVSKIMQGQVWRLVTFIIQPPSISVWTLIWLYMYYMIGTSLERAWGVITSYSIHYTKLYESRYPAPAAVIVCPVRSESIYRAHFEV